MKVIDLIDKLPTHKSKKYPYRALQSIDTIAIHHSLTSDLRGSKDVYAFAQYHVTHNDWPGIGYHYVIDNDGTVYKTNPAINKSYHVGKHNKRSIGICLVGDFRTDELPYVQYEAMYELVQTCMKVYKIDIDRVLGHSEFSGYSWKKCPEINMEEFRLDLMRKKKSDG